MPSFHRMKICNFPVFLLAVFIYRDTVAKGLNELSVLLIYKKEFFIFFIFLLAVVFKNTLNHY